MFSTALFRNRLLSALCLLCFSLACLILNAQNYSFSKYSIEEGLSQSVVNCILQDSKGFIWIGTQHGLNKFNGYGFEIFTHNPADSNSISNNWIYSVAEDRQGNLIVLTKDGINFYNRKKKTFSSRSDEYPIVQDTERYPYDVLLSGSGMIYFNLSPDLGVWDPRSKTWMIYRSSLQSDGSVKDLRMPLAEDHLGMIWMGSTKGLRIFNPTTKKFSEVTVGGAGNPNPNNENITALLEDRSGNMWMGTGNGLLRYERASGRIQRFERQSGKTMSISSNIVRSILQDMTGAMWIGTEGGGLNMLKFHANGTAFESYTAENSDLPHNIVNALITDRSGNLWIGTLKGISKTDLKPQKFRLYRRDHTPYSVDLLGNVIASLYKDDLGRIWAGNWGQGLNILDRKTGHVRHYTARSELPYKIVDDYVHCIFKDRNKRIWIGTRNGAMIWEESGQCFKKPEIVYGKGKLPDLSGVRINRMMQDAKGNYWFATQHGVYSFNPDKGPSLHFSTQEIPSRRISGNLVYSIAIDHEGLVWIATLNGLDRYDPSSGTMKNYRKAPEPGTSISDNFVISLCVDHAGDIWIGTGSGVNKFAKKNSVFSYYSYDEGLPADQVFEILEDGRNNLWFATGRGLTRFDPKSGTSRTFTVEEGLQSLEFNLNAAFKCDDGEMLFGGMNGFNSFYTDSVNNNSFVPEVCLTALVKSGSKGSQMRIDTENMTEVVLNYNDYSFTIEFAALEFTNPEKNEYAYRIEGISDQWIDIGNRHFVPFSNLSPGIYVFHVKGSNNDGIWNEKGTSLTIIVKPPWYQTTLAYSLYILALILLVFLYIRFRIRRLMKEKTILEGKVNERTREIERQKDELLKSRSELDNLNKELEKRVEERTAELQMAKEKAESSDRLKTAFMHNISHEIRTPLNGILGFGRMMLEDDIGQEEKTKYFDILQRCSERLLKNVTDYMDISLIVTGNLEVNPRRINIAKLLRLTFSRFEQAAKIKNLEFNLSIKPGLDEIHATTDPEIFDKIIGHLIDNAIKFTDAGKIEFGYDQREGAIRFFVSDTGRGIIAEDLDLVFEHFVQTGLDGKTVTEGSGLGLSIAKGMVELLGGRIWMKSTIKQGSTFYFTIPLEGQETLTDSYRPEPLARPEEPVVLIAEDDTSNQYLLSRFCEQLGMKVILVSDGQQAVDTCKENPHISLVIMDLKMPVMDGYAAAASIKQILPGLPVIAITAYGLTGDRQKALNAGCDDYLSKPVSLEWLRNCLRKYLSSID